MRLASFRDPSQGERLAVVADGRALPVSDLVPHGPRTMAELLAGGRDALAALGTGADPVRIAREGRPLDDLELLAPVPRPGKVVAIGRNYRDHSTEQGLQPPTEPIVFAKFTTAVVGHGAEIRWDTGLTDKVDWEAELGVIIGTTAREVSGEDALGFVLGFTCLDDVSARDLQSRDGQWSRAKSLDTFCPIGPVVVTADEIDASDLAIRCLVNGEVRQSARTSDLFFDVPTLIAFCSRSFTLEPGDVIATGTPSGVGAFRDPPIFLHDGDEVVVDIEGIGRLVNRCRTTGGS